MRQTNLEARSIREAISEIEALRGRPLAYEQFDADEAFEFESEVAEGKKE